MRLVKANVPTGHLDEVKDGLLGLGVERLRVVEISGYTEGCAAEIAWRGRLMKTHFLPEYELEAVVCDETVDKVVDVIIKTVRQSRQSDGFVCVMPVEECYRIRTGRPQF